MTNRLHSHHSLRLVTVLMLIVGLAVHIVLGMMVGLGLAAAGVALHVGVAVVGYRRSRRRTR